jgi:uncharacterized protein (DUF433 family)
MIAGIDARTLAEEILAMDKAAYRVVVGRRPRRPHTLRRSVAGASSMSSLPNPLITNAAERLGRTAVFAGTRVPVRSLIDYLEAGHALDHFPDEFPSVSREHAIAVLELATLALISPAA